MKDIVFRQANIDDAATLFNWRNDPETRANSLSTDPIEWREHLTWLTDSIKDPNRHLLIAFNGNKKEIGVVRFDLLPEYGKAYEISWTVAPEWRGKGFGKKMVQASLYEPFLKGKRIRARIKRPNVASRKIAKAANFIQKGESDGIEEWWRSFTIDRNVPMIISVLVDNPESWFVEFGHLLVQRLNEKGHDAIFVHSMEEIRDGDICFILSCEKIIGKETLGKNKHNIVIHSSALPHGKGMSPLTWQILEGKNEIPTTLFEANEKVDAGAIYFQKVLHFEGHELISEMQSAQGKLILEMALEFVDKYNEMESSPQKGASSVYRRRTWKDSELNIDKSIREQFDLLRVVNNERYPAFFNYKGHTYILKIYKKDDKIKRAKKRERKTDVNKVVAVIQARMGSRRLPGKALKRISGKTIIEIIAERIKNTKKVDDIVLAIPLNRQNDVLNQEGRRIGMRVFRGSEKDILSRMLGAAEIMQASAVLRITADCPLIDPLIIDRLVSVYKKNPSRYDYLSNIFKRTFPDGLDTEIFTTRLLKKLKRKLKTPTERELVSTYVISHWPKEKIYSMRSKKNLSSLHLTLDYPEDFKFISLIYRELSKLKKVFMLRDILDFIKKNPNILKINKIRISP